MKQHLRKKVVWQFLLSVMALGIFTLLATGSFEFLNDTTEYLGDGVYKSTDYYSEDEYEVTTGKHDDKKRWHGPVTINSYDDEYSYSRKEEVNMVHGKRHGKSKITMTPIIGDPQIYYSCYNMGKRVDCKESKRKSTANTTSFQVLSYEYPWFLYKLNAFGFEDDYVEPFLDTIELLLDTYEFEVTEFDDYYDDVIYDLEDTPYDSMITLNSIVSLYQGLEELKNSEFRLAVIDRYRTNGSSTYPIVESIYPGYLSALDDIGVNNQVFEGFCFATDSLMTSYGSLDLEDPFFLDSVDARMFRAIQTIYEYEEPSAEAKKSTKSLTISEISNMIKEPLIDSTTVEAASVVLYFMVLKIDEGNIIKQSVRKAYLMNHGVVSIPAVTTEFSGNTSATSATLNGYVIEDGGAEVLSRGIAWAAFYDPTTGDNVETSGTGTGEFAVTLEGLLEGATYYARTYAINSAGTAYGNCVKFIATSTLGIDNEESFIQDFKIYPNPASAFTTFSFHIESSENMFLTIVNLKGQVVYHHDLGSMPLGENQVELDLSGIHDGIYHCQLTNNGTRKVTRKFVIAH